MCGVEINLCPTQGDGVTKLNPSGLCECGCGNAAPLARQTNLKYGHVAGEPVRFVHGHHWRGRKRTQEERERMSKGQLASWASRSPEERKRGPMPQSQRDNISRSQKKGKDHWNWNDGRNVVDGYVYLKLPDHPMATRKGYVSEHRLVMSEHIGRLLERDEDVHHINGDRADNRIENLELVDHSVHSARKTERVYTTAIAALMVAGFTEERAAEALHISVDTVRKYRKD